MFHTLFPIRLRALPLLALASIATSYFGAPHVGSLQGPSGEPDVVPELLEGYLRQREQLTAFTGAVLVRQGDRVLLRQGYGMAEYELGVPNSPEMIFQLGSITKPFTSAAVLHAHGARLLDLDDSVCDFLAPCPAAWSEATIHHLLNHTSGIPDLFGAMDSAPLLETGAELERVVAARLDAELRRPAGATYAYSNFNYMLLGYILEAASGTDWESYLREAVFVPAGLQHTGYDDVWAIVEGRVRGYVRRDGELANMDYHDHSAYAAGGLHSTLDDLARFHDALMEGQIIPFALVDRALQPHDGNYGYGWQIIEILGRPMHNHTGGTNGATSHLAYYPDERLLIVVLNNVEGENPKGTACDLARLVFGVDPGPDATPDWLDQPNTDRCAERPSQRVH